MTPAEIDQLVQKCLDQYPPRTGGYHLKVDPSATRQDGDWWYVVVVPDRDGIRAHDYAEVLTEVEERLGADQSLRILLVPALAHRSLRGTD